MAEQLVGELLDNMEVKLDLEEGDQVIEVLVIAKIRERSMGISHGCNEGMDWVTQQGLIHGARILIERELNRSLED